MASRMYIVSSMKSTEVTRSMPMPKAMYDKTAMPRLRPNATEHVAINVTKKTIQHWVLTLYSMPILPLRHSPTSRPSHAALLLASVSCQRSP